MSAFTLQPLELTLRAPLRTAHGELGVRRGWTVCFEADGVRGWGEALPLPSFGTESYEVCDVALRRACGELEIQPGSPGEVDEALRGFEATPTARFALECALLDWLGRRDGKPVSAYLGATHRADVTVNALLAGETLPKLIEEARAARGAGFRTVKLKVAGRSIDEDVARVFAVREVVGSSVRLRIDANGGWTPDDALQALERLAPAELELCEQPTSPTDLETLAVLHARDLCPLAADEALLESGAVEWILEHRVCDVLVLKPAALGGLLRAATLAQRAAERGIGTYVTSLLDGELGRAAAAHLASTLPGPHAHGLATGAVFAAVDRTGWLAPREGVLRVPESPGLGVEGAR